MGKYIKFVGDLIVKKKPWQTLGSITYDKKWKCFVFEPLPTTKWSTDCLFTVIDELDRREEEKALKKAEGKK